MDNLAFNNQDIQITSVFFRQDSNQVRFESYPRQLVYKGHKYILADS